MQPFTVHALSESAADEARHSPGAVPALDGDGPYPVRCCLSDVEDGAEVVLASVMPFRGESPYAARSPVYIHAQRCAGHAREAGVIPPMLRGRLLSVRAYDRDHMLTGTEVLPGTELEGAIERLLGNAAGAYLHVHFAGPGCYACRIDRGLISAR
jgi:Protein of unknown function (DUF1203)